MANELPEYWVTRTGVMYRNAAGRVEWMISNSWRESFRSPADIAELIRTGWAWPCDADGKRLGKDEVRA